MKLKFNIANIFVILLRGYFASPHIHSYVCFSEFFGLYGFRTSFIF